jgi:hypothetical protein
VSGVGGWYKATTVLFPASADRVLPLVGLLVQTDGRHDPFEGRM